MPRGPQLNILLVFVNALLPFTFPSLVWFVLVSGERELVRRFYCHPPALHISISRVNHSGSWSPMRKGACGRAKRAGCKSAVTVEGRRHYVHPPSLLCATNEKLELYFEDEEHCTLKRRLVVSVRNISGR
ncbi:hypothetical protein B0H19DRAFT_531929 [Mycena capillaripes]|nr:hypothetical protein B0H19DRAFT_531929 [Mycena capillaripes]